MAQQAVAGGLIDNTLKAVDQLVLDYVFQTVEAVSQSLMPTFTALVALTMIITGLMTMTRMNPLNANVAMTLMIKLGVTASVFYAGPTIANVAFDLFTVQPYALIEQALTPQGQSAISTINTTYDIMIRFSSTLLFETGLGNLGLKLLGVVSLILSLGFMAVFLFLIAMSKVVLALLLGLLPLFAPMIFFKVTQGLFEGYIRQLINYALIPIFTFALVFIIQILITSQFEPLVQLDPDNLTSDQYFPLLILLFMGYQLLNQVTTIAGGISSSIGLGGADSAGAITIGAGKAATGAALFAAYRGLGALAKQAQGFKLTPRTGGAIKDVTRQS